MRALAVGEMLWDVFPHQELLGGAALNFCANLERLGDTARLITAVGRDDRGQRALAQMRDMGLSTQFVQTVENAPTGTASVSHDAAGEPVFRIPRPVAYDYICIDGPLLLDVATYKPAWIYIGTLLHTVKRSEALLRSITQAAPSARIFYDMNLRPGQWDMALVHRLCALASVAKLNEFEMQTLKPSLGLEKDVSLASFARVFCETFDVPALCITLGPHGCFVSDRGRSAHVPGIPVQTIDTVGAGDAFSAAFLHSYEQGLPIAEAAQFANAAGALVASRSGATPPWTVEELNAMLPPR